MTYYKTAHPDLARSGSAIVAVKPNGDIAKVMFDRDIVADARKYAYCCRDRDMRDYHRHRAYILLQNGLLDLAHEGVWVASMFFDPRGQHKINYWIYRDEHECDADDFINDVTDWIVADCGSYHYNKAERQHFAELRAERRRGVTIEVADVDQSRTLQMAVAAGQERRADEKEEKDLEKQLVEAIVDSASAVAIQ